MPSELLNRLQRFLRVNTARSVMNARLNAEAQPTHWPFLNHVRTNFGDVMAAVHSIVIHETTGWPSYQSANNFVDQYTSRTAVNQGIGPQFYVDGNGTAFKLIDIDPRRLTWHASFLNGIAFGIENGDIGDNPDIRPPEVHWRALTTKPANQDDLAGLKLFAAVHPMSAGDEDVVPIWFPTANYRGPGDLTHVGGFRMLFSEANYRTLALLCRYLAEELGIPRNFTLLPYEEREPNLNDVANLRKIVLADERAEMITRMLGKTIADFTANGKALSDWYTEQVSHRDPSPANRSHGKVHNVAWSNFFEDLGGPGTAADKRCYRGFLSHALPGAINIKPDGTDQDDHPCPGPYFDWHRFAREVWDWWWYPFDFEPLGPSQTLRPYRQARRDTPLISYYYDVDGRPEDYTGKRILLASDDSFNLPDPTPIYAMANGVLVAARINMSNSPAQPGFVLCRHEVFHEALGVNINYNTPPSYVYSLTFYLQQPGLTFDDLSDNNPDWLNRLIMRQFECDAAIAFKKGHAADVHLRAAWDRVPIPAAEGGRRLATGAQIERDADNYAASLENLRQGRPALFPLENQPGATPVRVILGDFLGFPNRMPGNQDGINISIFSRDRVAALPALAATQGVSVWAGEDWWSAASAPGRQEDDAAKNLPADGLVWHYPLLSFLPWINGITWTSEWDKYKVVNNAGARVDRPLTPTRRRIIP